MSLQNELGINVPIKDIENTDPSCDLEIIVFRLGTMLGCWVPVKIYVNGNLITKIGNKKAVRFKVPHGKIEFTTEFHGRKHSTTFTANECAKPVCIRTMVAYNKSGSTFAGILRVQDLNDPRDNIKVKPKPVLKNNAAPMRLQNPDDGHIDAYTDAYKWFTDNKESILKKVGEDFVKAGREMDDTELGITGITGISKKMMTDSDALYDEDPDGEFTDAADIYESRPVAEFVDKADDNAAFLVIFFGADGFDEDIECAVINCYTKEITYDCYCY